VLRTIWGLFGRMNPLLERKHQASFDRVARAEQASQEQHASTERAARVIAEMRRTDKALRGTRNG
jgi:hypothetical protein